MRFGDQLAWASPLAQRGGMAHAPGSQGPQVLFLALSISGELAQVTLRKSYPEA